jgi:hypothetical protein
MYTPQPGDEGLGLLLVALRDYLAADEAILELLPAREKGIVAEGFLTNDTPTPFIMPTVIGDGESAWGVDAQLVRLLIYAGDRGRGYSRIERLLNRIRRRINNSPAAQVFFTFPSTEPMHLLSIEVSGSSASATLPAWRAELRGLFVFAHLAGMRHSD